jgi:hypothetical protein
MNEKQEWIGSATELLADMETLAATMKVDTKSRAWPKGPQILIRRLNEVKATLEEVKIFITRGLDNKKQDQDRRDTQKTVTIVTTVTRRKMCTNH